MYSVVNITRIANFLEVSPEKIDLNKEQVVQRTTKTSKITGFNTILNCLINDSNNQHLKDTINNPEVQQWIDYSILYVEPGSRDKHVSQHLLKDFNNYLLTRSYFVGNSLTAADLAIFFSIYNLMKSLSPIEKENSLNLARWFDHLQQQNKILGNLEQINLSVIHLHGVSGTHL